MAIYTTNAICYGKDYSKSQFKVVFSNIYSSLIEDDEWENGYVNFSEIERIFEPEGNDSSYILGKMYDTQVEDWYFVELTWDTYDNSTTEIYLPIKKISPTNI
jgi:hypothetical protein